MSENPRSSITITLGDSRQVVKRGMLPLDGCGGDSQSMVGRKRSVKDRLSGVGDPTPGFNSKRLRANGRGFSQASAGDTGLKSHDLRFKIMRKSILKDSHINNQQSVLDLRDLLSRPAQSSNASIAASPDIPELSDDARQRFPELGNGKQPVYEMRKPKKNMADNGNRRHDLSEVTDVRPRMQEPNSSGIMGQVPSTPVAGSLTHMSILKVSSPLTSERLKRICPDVPLRQRPPDVGSRERSPDASLRWRSPDVGFRQRSPDVGFRQRSPDIGFRQRSPDVGFRQRTPDVCFRQRSLNIASRQRSPDVAIRRRSPEVAVRRRSPDVELGWRSPVQALRRRSPNVSMRHRSSNVALRRRSPDEDLRHRSPDVALTRRSPEVAFRRRSPNVRLRHRSPDIAFRRGPPDVSVRRRSPEVALRRRSPDVELRLRSPDVALRRRSPNLSSSNVAFGCRSTDVAVRRRSPDVDMRHRSPDVALRRRSPDVASRRRSPNVGLRRRSPVVALRRGSPDVAVRHISRDVMFSTNRGYSPPRREELQRGPSVRSYNDRGVGNHMKKDLHDFSRPRRSVPYMTTTELPAAHAYRSKDVHDFSRPRPSVPYMTTAVLPAVHAKPMIPLPSPSMLPSKLVQRTSCMIDDPTNSW